MREESAHHGDHCLTSTEAVVTCQKKRTECGMLFLPLIDTTPNLIVSDELSVISACANAVIPDDEGVKSVFSCGFLCFTKQLDLSCSACDSPS